VKTDEKGAAMKPVVYLSMLFLILSLARPLSAGESQRQHLAPVAQTQHEMNQQAEDDYKKSDAELNRVYKDLMGHLTAEQKKAMIDAELAWIRFRDANCACWALPHKGGSLHPLMYFGYMKSMTDDRIKQLKDMKRDLLIDAQK
jgi:uncharacterized protein YecT (DUF1311 family)